MQGDATNEDVYYVHPLVTWALEMDVVMEDSGLTSQHGWIKLLWAPWGTNLLLGPPK